MPVLPGVLVMREDIAMAISALTACGYVAMKAAEEVKAVGERIGENDVLGRKTLAMSGTLAILVAQSRDVLVELARMDDA
jgi:hypothetical protein